MKTTYAVQQGRCSKKTSTILPLSQMGQILYALASARFGRVCAASKTAPVVAPLVKQLIDLLKVKPFSKLFGKMVSLWNYLYQMSILNPLYIFIDFKEGEIQGRHSLQDFIQVKDSGISHYNY